MQTLIGKCNLGMTRCLWTTRGHVLRLYQYASVAYRLKTCYNDAGLDDTKFRSQYQLIGIRHNPVTGNLSRKCFWLHLLCGFNDYEAGKYVGHAGAEDEHQEYVEIAVLL